MSIAVVAAVLALSREAGALPTAKHTWTPTDLATAVGNAFVRFPDTFINWEAGFTYGPAVVIDGLFDAAPIVPNPVATSWKLVIDSFLDRYLDYEDQNSSSVVPCTTSVPYGPSVQYRDCARKLLSVQPVIPWNSSCWGTVGDRLGVFPSAYLSRYLDYNNDVQSKYATSNLLVAVNAVSEYLVKFPRRLPDGTFARSSGCCDGDGPQSTVPIYIWADDQFMGLTLMARLAACTTCGLSLETRLKYINMTGQMQLSFTKHLRSDDDGLNFHGAKVINNTEPLHSCCKWGRANGWGLMSHVEVLSALESFPGHPLMAKVQADFEKSVNAMIKFQHTSGLWHQIVNDSTSFLETSVTAMVTASLGRGLHSQWLKNSSEYWTALVASWEGLKSRVLPNGTVLGVCMGTGIMPNASQYNGRGTDFMQSSPGGVGALLKAAAVMHTLLP